MYRYISFPLELTVYVEEQLMLKGSAGWGCREEENHISNITPNFWTKEVGCATESIKHGKVQSLFSLKA